jgi:hypothetical protein
MSQYLILIYDDETAWANADEAAVGRIHEGHGKFGANNEAVIAGGNALQATSTATCVRPDGSGGFTVTDGPFAETKELIAGYWLWEVRSMEEAIEWVRRCPNPHVGDSDIEIRPIFSAEEFEALMRGHFGSKA